MNTDASRLTYIGKRDHREKIGDYYPDFYNAFACSAQSAETLRSALQHTDGQRWFVVYEHDRSAVPFLTIYGWKQENFF